MSGTKKIFQQLAPIIGGVAGNFLAPGIGGAIGSTLGGEMLGVGLGSAAGEALGGGNLKQDLTAGALGAGGAGLLGSSDIGGLLGLDGSIGSAASNALSGAVPGEGQFAGGPGGTGLSSPTAGTTGVGGVGSGLGQDFSIPGITSSASNAQAAADGAIPASQVGQSQALQSALNPGNPGASILSPGTSGVVNQAVGGAGANSNPSLLKQLGNFLTDGKGGGIGGSGVSLPQAASLTGIGLDLLKPPPKGTNQLLSAGASTLNAENQLVNTLASGKLPPGEQATIDSQVRDAQNTIRSHYANMGLSGSTQEQQALQAASDSGVQQAANYASQATDAGLKAAGATQGIYNSIIQSVLGGNNTLNSALASLGGGGQTKSSTGA